uniref:Proteasome subunit alpha type n=1 Tax=Rhabditophanes sp. KR3021 TaxID=114890 RepID=A0AC35UB07_9BILA
MFRNQYDSDVTVWSPQGRLHQVDYAVEAMKQGSATVGIKSNTHVVLVALKRAANELSSHQKKIFEVDSHAGTAISGLLSDGRILSRFLQSECSSWRWDYKENIPVAHIANQVQLKLQANTQYYGRRPFGVGLLIAGYDRDGTHLVKSEPSAEVVETYASAIGARSQSARTYLERHLDEFATATPEKLVYHALMALRDSLPAEDNLNKKNTSISIVGKGQTFKIMDNDDVVPYLDAIATVPRSTAASEAAREAAAGAQGPGDDAAEQMQQD